MVDITFVPTEAGFLYLVVVPGAFSGRIVGWVVTDHLRTELVLKTLDMAAQQRNSEEMIHHSDQGTLYTAIDFGERCTTEGIRPSMGHEVIATITQCVRASLQLSYASLSNERRSPADRKHAFPSSHSWRDGIIRSDCTRHLIASRQLPAENNPYNTSQHESLRPSTFTGEVHVQKEKFFGRNLLLAFTQSILAEK